MAYQSPYIGNNVGGGWGNFSGVQAMLERDWQSNKQGWDAMGAIGGALGSGTVGAFQGAANPGVMGKQTPAGGAFQGFMTNVDASLNQGGGGGTPSAFSGGGGRSQGGAMNFKQLELAGKSADSMWKAMAEGALTAPGEEPSAFGVTKGQWSTLGSREKMAVVGGAIQANAQKEVLAKLNEYAALTARATAQTAGLQQDNAANTAFQNAATAATFARGGGAPIRSNFEDVQAAAFANPAAPAAQEILQQTARAGGKLAPSLQFEEDPVSGTRFATYGNILSPSGVNPARAGNAVAITGPRGENLGVGLPGRSGVTPLQTGQVKDKDKYNRLSKQLNTLVDAQSRVSYNPTASSAYDKKIAAIAEQLADLEGGDDVARGADTATTNPPVFRYRKNPKTGQVETY